ncbi:hypothetical protein Dda_3769 [Drechslerella dactyloides]|uniref:GPI anchored protein n=1 Tax=Drechslerella dactyloides TaxID=74499 RepID=A0AAD6IYI2_DREDA|nr:hypothetical protein Dda_3769 [Drechslerella dactyloides]
MQLRTVVIFVAGLVATASASAEGLAANPAVKHVAARAINAADGSFIGLLFKRQSSCAEGLTACGSGCTEGPCCDTNSGLACRPGEICTQINGQTGCCAEGYVCGTIRGCENASDGCTAGSVDENGVLCCDAAAPECSTSADVPICAATAPTATFTVNPDQVFDSTSTTSVTMTSTLTLTVDSDSNVIPPETNPGAATETATSDESGGNGNGAEPATTTTATDEVLTILTTDVSSGPTETGGAGGAAGTETGGAGGAAGTDTGVVAPTATDGGALTTTPPLVIPVPVPVPTGGAGIGAGNGTGTGTGNVSTTVSPPEATGAAGKLGVSGFALSIALGLAFIL